MVFFIVANNPGEDLVEKPLLYILLFTGIRTELLLAGIRNSCRGGSAWATMDTNEGGIQFQYRTWQKGHRLLFSANHESKTAILFKIIIPVVRVADKIRFYEFHIIIHAFIRITIKVYVQMVAVACNLKWVYSVI